MNRIAIAIAAASVLILTGCVTSSQARGVQPGGFLGDSASLLTRGERGEEALLVYVKEGVDWPSYQKVILDPVAIWSVKPSVLSEAEAAQCRAAEQVSPRSRS